MDEQFFYFPPADDLDRVDGIAKVTGKAKYSAEYDLPGLVYGVLAGSKIAKGKITAMDTKQAERAPGVLSVITHLNCPKVPGHDAGGNPAKGPVNGKPLQIFNDPYIHFYGQPVALVIAGSLEQAVYAASLVKAQYEKETSHTDLRTELDQAKPLGGNRYNDYLRGEADAYKKAPVRIEAEYILPLEVHNPMELHATTAVWEGEDRVKVYEKTQGVKSTQRSIMQTFRLEEKNVQVISQFVGGGFGSALRTWPHVTAALIGAKKLNRPLKLVLGRDQMFQLVGFRPYTIQKMGIGASADGRLTGITHEAFSHTSTYEEFTEGTVNVSRLMYACPNVNTRYKVYALDISTPTWMRGPGEATGAFALECALDELAYALNIDPVDLRILNYAETDPQNNKPYSSKFLKEAYELGMEKIGWKSRNRAPRSMTENGWLVGYGMGSGVFGASRGNAKAAARFYSNGNLVVQSAVSDSGPGTATTMVKIASDAMGLPLDRVSFELGDSNLPPGPTQGGSTTTSTMGSAVYDVCISLKKKMAELAAKTSLFRDARYEDLHFENGSISLASDPSKKISYAGLLNQSSLGQIEVTEESKGSEQARKYASYSYSVHFIRVLVHPLTGVVKLNRIVSVVDSGKVISEKTGRSQIIGGVVGGIGMALTEEGVIDHRFGKWVNNNLADYHVPVQADVPYIECIFVNKPDPVLNPVGAKGMGEVALIGTAPAIANAIYHATGKRVRELPITPDKLIQEI